jgi:ABC-type transport system substrate-binding protein
VRLVTNTAAAMPEVSADGKAFTVRLHSGIFFADDPAFGGRPRELVAADYAYAIKRHFDPRWKSPRYAGLKGLDLVGVDALRQRAVDQRRPFDYDAPVEGLQTPDRYTLRLRTGHPTPRLVDLLAQGAVTGAVAREVVEHYGEQIPAHPVGTGPFRLVEWRRSSRIVLERSPRFREELYAFEAPAGDAQALAEAKRLRGRRLPMVDRVEIAVIEASQPMWLSYLANDFDLLTGVPYEYAGIAAPGGRLAPNLARRGMQLHRYLRPDVAYTFFNLEDPLVGGYTPDKVALRRAIGLAYDNAAEIRLLRKGLALPAQGLVTPMTFGYDPNFRSEMSEYSPPRAKALLDLFGYVDRDGDGWRERPDGSPLVLRMHTQPDESSRQFNEQWRKDLAAVGLRIVFEAGQWPEQHKQARAGRLMMWGLGWTSTSPDPADVLSTADGRQKGGANLCRFDLPEFNRLFAASEQRPDDDERAAQVLQMQKLLIAWMPFKAHAHRIRLGLNQPWVIGYRPHPFVRDFARYIDIDPSLVPKGAVR